MKKILFSLLAIASFSVAKAQILWSEDFTSVTPPALPANWVQINGDGLTVATNLNAFNFGTLGAVTCNAGGTHGKAACMTSWYSPVGISDDWLITPAFTPIAGHYLVWDVASAEAAPYQEGYEIRVSTTAGTTAASFAGTPLLSIGAENAFWYTRIVDLSAYAGQNIRIAFHDNSNDKDRAYFDNISVRTLPASSAKMTAVSPLATDASAFGTVGSNKTLSCTIQNTGLSAMTSYTINYKDGANPVVSQTVSGSVTSFAYNSTTFTTQYNIASAGAHNLKVWVTLAGDTDHSDDTLTTTITGVSFMPARSVVMEEPTGTWCGWCVRGVVYMDSIYKAHPNDVVPISVHNGDPMTVTAYDAGIGTLISGYPSLVVDRKEVADPQNAFTMYTKYISDFGFATVNLPTPTLVGSTLTVNSSIVPATNLTGEYRLALVVTEDRVHSTAGGTWDQKNYYAVGGSGNATPMANAEYNFNTLPGTIPSSTMYYDFVAKDIVGGFDGATGTLPASMTAGTTYSHPFTWTLPSGTNPFKLRVAVLLIDKNSTNSKILNAKMTNVYPAGVSTIAKNEFIEAVAYPNPAKDVINLDLTLTERMNTTYSVVDMMGNTIETVNLGKLNSGLSTISINTSAYAKGMYSISIKTENGTYSSKFTKQ